MGALGARAWQIELVAPTVAAALLQREAVIVEEPESEPTSEV